MKWVHTYTTKLLLHLSLRAEHKGTPTKHWSQDVLWKLVLFFLFKKIQQENI